VVVKIDAATMLKALQGVISSIWEWLSSRNALQRWSRTYVVSQKGTETEEDIYVDTVLRISEAFKKGKRQRKPGFIEEAEACIARGDLKQATNLFMGYAYGVFWRVASEHNRRVKRDPPTYSEISEGSVEPQELVSTSPSSLERGELELAVARAIDQLSDSEKLVILGKFFSGMTNKEVRVALGCSENSVRALQAKAIRKLRILLRDWQDGAP